MSDFLIFTVIAALMGMGVGGGGLLVIWLTLVENAGQLAAQGINLYFFIFASAASLPVHLLKRNLDFKTIFTVSASGVVASLLGCYLATVSSESTVRKVFAGLLVLSGAIVLIRMTADAVRKRKDKSVSKHT